MKRLKLVIATFAVAVFGLAVLAPAGASYAINPLDDVCSSNGASEVCDAKNDNAGTLISQIVNTLLFIIGALAVVMIIFGGIQYTTSAGDAGRVAKAKNTIIYSVVGLIVAFLAYAVVNWVLQLF